MYIYTDTLTNKYFLLLLSLINLNAFKTFFHCHPLLPKPLRTTNMFLIRCVALKKAVCLMNPVIIFYSWSALDWFQVRIRELLMHAITAQLQGPIATTSKTKNQSLLFLPSCKKTINKA